ncbi:putative chromatin modification-related protein [Lyophyllum shimeji]|uniref:Chromatin modification-related protein n=1 Tax=Lyophyllum shimeji TaxID=47721 RepID=A0A9P3PYM9_LYOSH|nr:putative chromatin modification-related protein [Lyophyllum shimeji]
MAPSRAPVAPVVPNDRFTTAYSLSLLSEYTHTLDSLPLDLSRNFADLRELDAVLSSSMASITAKINTLTAMIEQGTSPKEERLWLLTEIAEEAARLKLGGEDKIRVACQAADNLKHNMGHLRALAESIPGFDASTLNRKTTYPHVAARSYMPAVSLETGRRRRGGYGSLLTSAPDPSPAKKRQRVQRDDDLDVVRSPRKDKTQDANPRSRARARKNDRLASPSESIVSVTSHVLSQSNGVSTSRGITNATSRAMGSASASANKRARPTAQHNNRSATPHMNDQYLTHEQNGIIHTHANGHSSRRDAYNVPPASLHPSLPLPYPNGSGSHHASPYDIHVMPNSIVGAADWNPPLTQQLEGPGMPVSRGHTVMPVIPINTALGPGIPSDPADPGDGEGDGDDRTYCICNSVSYGEMIACDDSQCEREWFHLTCINLAVPPEGRWFCDACRNKRNAKRSGRGGKRRTGGGRAGARAS